MRNPKVSVMIPVYNGEKTLSDCLRSVLNQNFKDYEVVVVDNCSTDNTKEIIQSFMDKDSRVRYVYEPNKSRGAARNKGIKSVVGEIVAMTDSDCIVSAGWLGQITKPIIEGKENIVMGTEKNVANNFWSDYAQKEKHYNIKKCIQGNYICTLDTKNCAFNRKIFSEYLFDEELGHFEDHEFGLRLLKSKKIYYMKDCVVSHHEASSVISFAIAQIERGRWAGYTYDKYKYLYKDEKTVMTDPPFIQIQKGTKEFIGHIKREFRRNPIKDTLYRFVAGSSWRVGVYLGRRSFNL